MENAAELAGAASKAVPTGFSVLSGYVLPGLGTYLRTLGGAVVGTVLTLVRALVVGQSIGKRTGRIANLTLTRFRNAGGGIQYEFGFVGYL
jgi:hypothetical protein